MGMQNLRTKLRRRKYRLGLGRRSVASDDEADPGSSYTNTTSEWQFEYFSPWMTKKWPTAAPPSPPPEPNASSPSPEAAPVPPPRGIRSFSFRNPVRRPSSWTPADVERPPPVPLHSWQKSTETSSRAAAAQRCGSSPEPAAASSLRSSAVTSRSLRRDAPVSSVEAEPIYSVPHRTRPPRSAVTARRHLQQPAAALSEPERRQPVDSETAAPLESQTPRRQDNERLESAEYKTVVPTKRSEVAPQTTESQQQLGDSAAGEQQLEAATKALELDQPPSGNSGTQDVENSRATKTRQQDGQPFAGHEEHSIPPAVPPHAPGVVCTPRPPVRSRNRPVSAPSDADRLPKTPTLNLPPPPLLPPSALSDTLGNGRAQYLQRMDLSDLVDC